MKSLVVSNLLLLVLATAQPSLALAPAPQPAASRFEGARSAEDVSKLLEGVTNLGRPGQSLPGEVIAFGESAFLVASAGKNEAERGTIGAANFHKGAVVAFGHSSFLESWEVGGDGERFLANAIRWSGGVEHPRVAYLGGGEDLRNRLEGSFPDSSSHRTFADLPKLGKGIDVVVWVGGALDSEQLEDLRAFVKRGGGVLLGVCPWGNQQIWDGQGKGKSIRVDLAQNQFLVEMGLVLGDATIGDATYTLASAGELPHAGRAVAAAIAYIQGEEGRIDVVVEPGAAASQVAGLLRALPATPNTFQQQIEAALRDSAFREHVPAKGRPTLKSNVAGHLGMLLATETWKDAAPEDIEAAPGSDFFPGAVPKIAKRLNRTVDFTEVQARNGGWLSTGLYAGAGEVIRVSPGTVAAAEGWKIRIGSHKDQLWQKDSWSRWPEVTLERRIDVQKNGAFEVASPFGGLIYLVPGEGAGEASFTIFGAVEAPLFILGDKQSKAEWKKRREAPAPWAELVCEGMILTVPAGAIRELEDPTSLMEYWERAAECYPELRGEPQPARAERMVEDIQISAGWMHSGYPVMTHGAERTDHSASVDLKTLTTVGNWGYFHEFGHNAQRREWTFEGTGEVTNNLFSLYLGEKMAGIEPWDNPWLENQKGKPAKYFASGAKFDEWKKQPGLALMMYATVQREFGWAPFQAAFKAYLTAPKEETPVTEEEKRSVWLVRLSEALGRDLGPYFEYWGVPTSKEVRAKLVHFEPWMPKEYGQP